MAIERIARFAARRCRVRGDNIDTDRIIPARFLRSVSFEGLEQHLFEDDRAAGAAARHPLSNPRYSAARLMFVETQLRMRIVAGARAAGDSTPRDPRGGRRVVLGDLLRQLRGAGRCRARGEAPDGARLLDGRRGEPGSGVRRWISTRLRISGAALASSGHAAGRGPRFVRRRHMGRDRPAAGPLRGVEASGCRTSVRAIKTVTLN